jgi:hypothetical protein
VGITKNEGTGSIGKSFTGFIKVFFGGVNCFDGRALVCNIERGIP